MQFYVYVLYSVSHNQIYIGYSSRIKSHNELAAKGFTVRYRPWTLLHKEVFESKILAMKRERELKSAKGREFIRKTLLHQ
jgi:putative endonuclease